MIYYNRLSEPQPLWAPASVVSCSVPVLAPEEFKPLSAAVGGRDMLHNIAQCQVLLTNPATDLRGDLGRSRVASDLVVHPQGEPGASILPMREASSIL